MSRRHLAGDCENSCYLSSFANTAACVTQRQRFPKQDKRSECVFSEIELYYQLLPNDVDVLKIPLLSLLSSLLLNGILSINEIFGFMSDSFELSNGILSMNNIHPRKRVLLHLLLIRYVNKTCLFLLLPISRKAEVTAVVRHTQKVHLKPKSITQKT